MGNIQPKIGFATYAASSIANSGGNTNYTLHIPRQQQVDLMAAMHAKYARISARVDPNGSVNNPDYGNLSTRYIDFITKANAAGIECITCLHDRLQYDINSDEYADLPFTEEQTVAREIRTYDSAYNFSLGFAQTYIDILTTNPIVELGNEPELFRKLMPGGTNGVNPSVYYPLKLRVAMKHWEGMIDGLKAGFPNVQIASPASAGYCPVGLYDQFFETLGNDITYTNWHWYHEMEGLLKAGSFPVGGASVTNITDFLYGRYGKPVIFTECNRRGIGFGGADDAPESGDVHQDGQVNFFSSFYPEILANPNAKAAICYTLLSNVNDTRNTWEPTYGIYYFPGINTSLPPAEQDFIGTLTPKKVVEYFTNFNYAIDPPVGTGLKYIIPYKDITNKDRRVEIYVPNYVGDPIELRGVNGGAFILNWNPDEETMSHVVISSSATIQVYQQNDSIDIFELQTASDRDIVVRYYEEDVLKWQGFLVSDGIMQTFQAQPFELQLQAVDGLQLLEGINTTSPNTTATGTPNRAPINYFRDLLWNRLGNELPIRFAVDGLECLVYPDENVMAGSVQWSPRGQGYTDENGTTQNAFWTIQGQTDSFFARIYQSNGEWVVERKPTIISGVYDSKVVTGITITDQPVDVLRTIGKTGDYHFVNEDASLTVAKPLLKVSTTYEQSQKENIIPNGNFIISSTGRPLYWESSHPNGECSVFQEASINERSDERSIRVGYPSGSPGDEEYVTPYDGEEGIPIDMHTLYKTINVSFEFMPLTGFSYYSTSGTDANGVYREQGEINWDNNPMRIMLQTFLPVGGIAVPYVLNEFGFWIPMPTGAAFNRYNYQGYAESPTVQILDSYFSGSPIVGDYINRSNDGTEISRAYTQQQQSNNLVAFLNYAGQYMVDTTDAISFEVIADGTTGYILRIRRPNSGTNIVMGWGTSTSLRDGTISITVDKMKIGDSAQVNLKSGNSVKLPDPGDLDQNVIDDRIGKLYYRLYVRKGQEIKFGNVNVEVNDNSDLYVSNVQGNNNTGVEDRSLTISSSFNGFYVTNYMTAWTVSNTEYKFSNGIDEGSLTRLHNRDTLKMRCLPSILFSGSINVRSGGWKFGEVYEIATLNGKKFLSLGATYNTEKAEVQLRALEAYYNNEMTIITNHYGSESEPINI